MNFENHITQDKTKWVISFVLIAVLIIGLAGVIIKLIGDEPKVVRPSAYKVATLNDEGKEIESEEHICTKDFYTVDGLKCELEDDAEITYQLFFYTENETFISSTGIYETEYREYPPSGAKYFKVVITPKSDAKITSIEKRSYAKQLTITIEK